MTDASSSSVFLATRALGISTSLFLSGKPSLVLSQTSFLLPASNKPGYAFSASQLAIPAIALSPVPLRLKQWAVIYNEGALVSPTFAASSLLLWSYSAWSSYHSTSILNSSSGADWKLYLLAGGLTFSILPWTLTVLMPVNKELMRRVKVVEERSSEAGGNNFGEESGVLIKRWDRLHFVRACLPLLGAWVGLYGALRA